MTEDICIVCQILCLYEWHEIRLFLRLAGVRQGENLSPLLCSSFINDLGDYLIDNGCMAINLDDANIDNYLQLVLLYADNTIVMSNTKEGLQKAIDLMCGFCERWKLKINSGKTKVTVFGCRKTDKTEQSEF